MIKYGNSGSNDSTEAAAEPVSTEPQGNKKTPLGPFGRGLWPTSRWPRRCERSYTASFR